MKLKKEDLEEFYNRLEAFIAFKHPSKRKGLNASFAPFEGRLGLPNATISKAVKGRTNFYIDRILKINETYPELNMNWLFGGEGEMLKESYTQNNTNSGDGTQINQQANKQALAMNDGNTNNLEGGETSEMVKELMNQLKEKDRVIAEKDKRIEKLTDKLLEG